MNDFETPAGANGDSSNSVANTNEVMIGENRTKVFFAGHAHTKSKSHGKRTRLSAQLPVEKFEITNIWGDQKFTLDTAEKEVIQGNDDYVFFPLITPEGESKGAKESLFQVLFMAASLMVGVQTRDKYLLLDPEHPETSPHKQVILINPTYEDYPEHSATWDPFLAIAEHLQALGTISKHQPLDKIFLQAYSSLEAAEKVKNPVKNFIPPSVNHNVTIPTEEEIEAKQRRRERRRHNVCVFCSASTQNDDFLDEAFELGKSVASKDWGLVSGAGTSGSMGRINDGANEIIQSEDKGWVGGSNLIRIFGLEGVPENMDEIWIKPDIYTRMLAMIENSDSFVIMPGGMGTVQEFMALLLLKHKEIAGDKSHTDIMKNKPIVVVNQKALDPRTGESVGIWDPLIALAKRYGFEKDFVVVDTQEQAVEYLEKHYQALDLTQRYEGAQQNGRRR